MDLPNNDQTLKTKNGCFWFFFFLFLLETFLKVMKCKLINSILLIEGNMGCFRHRVKFSMVFRL